MSKRKPLADMSYRDLLEEEWNMLFHLPELFSNPSVFLHSFARPFGLFLLWISVVIFLFQLMHSESQSLVAYLNDTWSGTRSMEIPSA